MFHNAIFDDEDDNFEIKKVKYVKLIPKKFKEEFIIDFQDLIKKGLLHKVFESKAIQIKLE